MRPSLLLAVLIASLALPAGALAAEGSTSIDLGGPALSTLRSQGVKLVAKRPAKLKRGTLTLPVRQGLVGTVAHLNHGGSLQLRKGSKVVKLTRLQSQLGAKSYLNATLGDRRIRLLEIAVKAPSLNAAVGSASARNVKVTLTGTAARAIKKGLELKRAPSGRFGRATVDALVEGTGTSPGGGTDPGGGDGPPSSGPITAEPPVLARPATAVDLASATVVWHVRDSWIRYVSTENDVQAIEDATPGAPVDNDQHPCSDAPNGAAPPLVYSYTLPFANGWHDAASGQTAIYTSGGAHFSYPGHGIDLTVRNLEIELTGATARVIARFAGSGNSNPGDKRGVFINLATPVAGLYKGSIPSGGSESVFGGFYTPGAGFGCVSVSY